jgi:hypothetical protein
LSVVLCRLWVQWPQLLAHANSIFDKHRLAKALSYSLSLWSATKHEEHACAENASHALCEGRTNARTPCKGLRSVSSARAWRRNGGIRHDESFLTWKESTRIVLIVAARTCNQSVRHALSKRGDASKYNGTVI